MSAAAEPLETVQEHFVHPALFYRDEGEYLDGTVSFVREGLAAGEPVAVAVPGDRLRLIRDALGDDADAVRLLDMREAGRNPGRIIPGVLRAFADTCPAGQRVRIIGEPIWAGRSAAEYPACVQHEALINAAFQGRRVTILCPYDAVRLPGHVLADAYATHPTVIPAGSRTVRDSEAYAPDAVVARYNEPLPLVADAMTVPFAAESLPSARHAATEEGRRLGLTGITLEDLALATAELTTNSVLHGGGAGVLRIWAEGGHVLCEVRDGGRLTDPLAGRRPASRDQRGGRGLLLVNLIADLVRVHTGDEGTTIRCWFAR
ncbi:anti-sigma regulatory factor (Ser/Thr protein kinase) [Streptomyces albaduncus]|uniref:Anti-sigma regulatory factor (Ser/Thr protein kinase) n=2 Tax=Streptomyces griseoloalbus TaxID=67303 RepID=A0A7W8BLV5_9ACTN|nr:anti-sigma factor RsbA family regulatory protein [Streptomyces albaduncus]MBB5123824.1 anti-sigma regulatory factor (Ser/Thr protein kinase) [Streptomyces albaduncus]